MLTTPRGPGMAHRIFRLSAVEARTGPSRSTIFQCISDGAFPPQIFLEAPPAGWIEQSTTAWIKRQRSRRSKAGYGPFFAVRGELAAPRGPSRNVGVSDMARKQDGGRV